MKINIRLVPYELKSSDLFWFQSDLVEIDRSFLSHRCSLIFPIVPRKSLQVFDVHIPIQRGLHCC